jgi:hypothetical protein
LTVAFLGLLAVVAVLALVGLFLPSSAHLERSITIEVPPATVFGLLNGFEWAHEWSPWRSFDPDARYALEGPAAGVGARVTWVSDHPRLGSGSEQITQSHPDSLVTSTLDLGGTVAAASSFSLEAAPGGTRLTWRLETDLGDNLVARYFGLGFDRMLGPDCERGLASLRELAENLPDPDRSDPETGE